MISTHPADSHTFSLQSGLSGPPLWLLIVCLLSSSVSAQTNDYEAARKKMIKDVILGGGVTNERVVQAMRDTLRHEFVGQRYRTQAYYDMALPIGESQTISSPYIVAFMTQSIDPQPDDRVLEIGTGSGYQAAVLSPLVKEVYTIEIVESLGRRAEQLLKRLKYDNVFVKIGDGYQGWPEHEPFDKIIVTCSPEKVPQPLVDQLREGGLIVIPVGERYQQILYLMRKRDGKMVAEKLQPTLFVPMTGKAEDTREVKPDPLNPKVVNGDFEEEPLTKDYVAGWYYQHEVKWMTGNAAQGEHYIEFQNEVAGRPAFLLQGLPIDGEHVRVLKISASVKLDNVQDQDKPTEHATIAVTFYDENRRELSLQTIGRLRGTHDWREIEQSFRVPPLAHEMLLRVGLFGATGKAAFDNIQFEVRGEGRGG